MYGHSPSLGERRRKRNNAARQSLSEGEAEEAKQCTDSPSLRERQRKRNNVLTQSLSGGEAEEAEQCSQTVPI